MIDILEKDGATIITIENPTSDEMKIISEAKRVKDAPASPVKKSAWNKPKTTATTDNPTESKRGWGNRKPAQTTQTTTEKSTSWKSANENKTPAPVSKPTGTGSKWSKSKLNAPKQNETTPTIPKPAPPPTAEELAGLGDEWELILGIDDVPF